jgi:hypothetical protein
MRAQQQGGMRTAKVTGASDKTQATAFDKS